MKNKNIDAMAEARKSKKFQQYSKEAVRKIKRDVMFYSPNTATNSAIWDLSKTP